MSILQNMEYNKVVGTVALVGATFLSPTTSYGEDILSSLAQKASYDQFIDYSSLKQSTVGEPILKNDKDMIVKMEIYEIEKVIQKKYNTKVLNYWIPAEGMLEKSCLFVSLEEQNVLLSKYDDFELDLYLSLEEKFKQSQLINMIALM